MVCFLNVIVKVVAYEFNFLISAFNCWRFTEMRNYIFIKLVSLQYWHTKSLQGKPILFVWHYSVKIRLFQDPQYDCQWLVLEKMTKVFSLKAGRLLKLLIWLQFWPVHNIRCPELRTWRSNIIGHCATFNMPLFPALHWTLKILQEFCFVFTNI